MYIKGAELNTVSREVFRSRFPDEGTVLTVLRKFAYVFLHFACRLQ